SGHEGKTAHHLRGLVKQVAALIRAAQKALEAALNEPRIDFVESPWPQTLRLEHARSVIVHEDIRGSDQAHEGLAAQSLLVIETQAALRRIESKKIALVAAADTRLISRSGALHLDHLSTELREEEG